jgi:hypothetical protein
MIGHPHNFGNISSSLTACKQTKGILEKAIFFTVDGWESEYSPTTLVCKVCPPFMHKLIHLIHSK